MSGTAKRTLLGLPPGTGVRVAVVDSGIDGSLVAEGRSFAVRASGILTTVERCPPGDVHHHGTAVATVLRALAGEAQVTSIRVVDELGRTSVGGLRAALDFAVRERFDVVNVSLGTRRREVLLDLYDLVDQATVAGVVVVAATDNRGPPDYPAACTALLGVGAMKAEDPFALSYVPGQRIAFLARGEDVPLAFPDGSERRVSGSSYACPHVAAFAARIRAGERGLPPFALKSRLFSWAVADADASASSSVGGLA